MSVQPTRTPEQQATDDARESVIGCAERVSARIGVAKTNGPGRQPETVLATPIRDNEQEDYPEW